MVQDSVGLQASAGLLLYASEQWPKMEKVDVFGEDGRCSRSARRERGQEEEEDIDLGVCCSRGIGAGQRW